MVYRSGLKVAPSAARLQLELDRLSWSAGCGDRTEGWEGGPAHSRWPGNVLENKFDNQDLDSFFTSPCKKAPKAKEEEGLSNEKKEPEVVAEVHGDGGVGLCDGHGGAEISRHLKEAEGGGGG